MSLRLEKSEQAFKIGDIFTMVKIFQLQELSLAAFRNETHTDGLNTCKISQSSKYQCFLHFVDRNSIID